MRLLLNNFKTKFLSFLGLNSNQPTVQVEDIIEESQLQQNRRELVVNIYSYYGTNLPMKKGTVQFINPRSGKFTSEDIYELTIKVKPDNDDISVNINKFERDVAHLESEIALFKFVSNKCELTSMTYDGEVVYLPNSLRLYKNETKEID